MNVLFHRVATARWLARETEAILNESTLGSVLYEECCTPSASLSPAQEQLLCALTRLPDCLANQLGRTLPSFLQPLCLFSSLGRALLGCLHRVYTDLQGMPPPVQQGSVWLLTDRCAVQLVLSEWSFFSAGGKDRSLAFPEAVLSKAAVLGHAGRGNDLGVQLCSCRNVLPVVQRPWYLSWCPLCSRGQVTTHSGGACPAPCSAKSAVLLWIHF